MPTCQLASGTAASALWLLVCAWAACSTDAVSVVGTGDTAPTVASLVAVDLTGTLAYVAGGTSLTAVRTADKHSPAAAGKVELPGSASSIIEKGGFVYVAGSTGVYIVDVGDPSALSVVDSHPVAGGCLDVFFDAPSTKLFAACGTSGVLRFNVAPLWKLALTETAAPPAGVASFTSIATFVDPSTGVSRAYVCGAAETLTIYASLDLALVKANAGVACGFVRPAGDGAVMLAAAAGVTWVGPERLDNSVPPKLEPTPVLAAYSSSGATGSTDAQLALGVPQELLVTVSGGGLHVYDIATRFIDVQPTANVPSPGQPMSRAVVRGDWAFVAAGSSGLLVVLLRGTDTVAPMTDVPDTAVPETAVPKTSVPETEVPETRVPETPVPATKVPDTNVPDTNVPDTSVPDTAVPATNVPDTAVPDTAVPATNVPDTSVPETAVPTTNVPDTNAPDTNVPNTAVPATDVPPTSVPETPTPAVPETPNPPAATGAPGTSDTAVPQLSQTDAPVATQTTSLVPESPAPPTPVPGSAMPDKVQKAAHDAAGTAATVSPMGGRFAVLVGLKCEVDDIDLEHAAPLDFEFSPTRLALGGQGYEQRYFLGAVVGNTALVVGFFLANYAVAYGLRACFGLSFENAVFFSRVPGLTYIAILYLMMGTALSGANLLFFSSGNPVSVVAGLLALGYCVAVPVLMWTRLLRPAVFHGVLQPDARLDPTTAAASPTGKQVKVLTGWRRGAYEFVFGPCVWVRKEGGPDFFVEQYGMFFEQYRGGYQWFSIVELTQAIVLALTSVLKPTTPTTCTVRNVWLTLVLLAFFVSVVRWKPFNSRLDQLVASAMTGMMFLAVLLMSVTLLMHGNPESVSKYFLSGSGFLLFCSAGLALMKGIYDIALYALDIFIGRRRGAFRAARCKDAGWKGDGSLLLHGDEGEELAVAAPYDSDDRSSCCSVGGSGSGSGTGGSLQRGGRKKRDQTVRWR
eukprot:Rhum_TRINITY_DN14340_c17_g1::Rhum_TRINITY_DN14340_c17_g1_i1::g.83640::m.83640